MRHDRMRMLSDAFARLDVAGNVRLWILRKTLEKSIYVLGISAAVHERHAKPHLRAARVRPFAAELAA